VRQDQRMPVARWDSDESALRAPVLAGHHQYEQRPGLAPSAGAGPSAEEIAAPLALVAALAWLIGTTTSRLDLSNPFGRGLWFW